MAQGDRSDDIFMAVLVFFAALAVVLLIVFAVTTDDKDTGSGCEATYEKHLENAREFDYEPDDRSAFIAECQRGHDQIGG